MSKFAVYAAIAGSSVASDDLLLIKDTSATATKKLPWSDVLQAALLVSTTTAIVASNVLSIGANLATNPVFAVDFNTSSVATGLKVTGAPAAAGVDLSVTSSGTNENLTINARGSGTIALNPTGTGNVITTRPIVITSASANAVAVGRLGTTTPAFVVDASTATSITGFSVKSAASGGGVALAAIGETNVATTLDAKGSGTLSLNPVATGAIVLGRAATGVSLAVTGALTSSGATNGVGYATGAGGAVTQGTSRTTGVTLNTICGAITLISAAGSTSIQSFTVTNSAVAATDVVNVCQKSGTDLYRVYVTAVAAGSFQVSYATLSGTTTEQPVFNFTVTKAVVS